MEEIKKEEKNENMEEIKEVISIDNPKLIRIKVEDVKDVVDKNTGELISFKNYYYVDKEHKGKLIRASILKENSDGTLNDMSQFEDMHKFEVKVGYFKIAKNYEYPRVYIGDFDFSSIKKIY